MRRKIAALCVLIASFFLFLHPVNSGDFFHHLATGRDIVTTGKLPRTDTWTFTAFGKPWIAHSWGSGVVYYLIYTLAGYHGISVFFALIGVATVWLISLSSRSLLVGFMAAALLSLRWPSRPEVMAPFFSALLLFLMPRRIRLTPILIWAWALLYGSSVFLGIILLTSYLLIHARRIKPLLWVVLLSLLAANANGYGWKSFFYIFFIPAIAGNVGEWLPVTRALDPANPGVALFYQYQVLVYGVFALGTIFLVLRYHADRFSRLLALSVALPFFAVRFMNLTPVLAAPFLSSARTAKLLFLAIGIAAAYVRIITYPIGTGLSDIPFASSSIRYLADHNVHGTIFASQELGGFLAWELPDSFIFYDTRDDLFVHTDVANDLARLHNGQTDLRTILRKYRADIVIADVDSEIAAPLLYLTTWKLVHVSDNTMVLVRSPVAEAFGLTPLNALDPTKVPPAKSGSLNEAVAEQSRVLSERPSPENRIRMAELLLARGETAQAMAIIDALSIEGFSGAAAPIVFLGLAEIKAKFALAAGRCADAKTALMQADRYRLRPFLFSPTHELLSGANLYWGTYYTDCERDLAKARQYYIRYAVQTPNARERRQIEQLLDRLGK